MNKSIISNVSIYENSNYNKNKYKNNLENINNYEYIDKYINTTPIVKSINEIERIREYPAYFILHCFIGHNILIYTLEQYHISNTFIDTSNIYSSSTIISYIQKRPTKTLVRVQNKNAIYTLENYHEVSKEIINIIYSHNQLYTNPGNTYFTYGLITKNEIKQIDIISAYTSDLIVTDILIPEYIGIDVDLNINDVIPAMGNKNFILTIYLDRGATVLNDAEFSIILNNNIIIPFHLTLTRQIGLLNSFKPDYKTYTEYYKYYTSTFKTLNGIEHRKSLLENPKKALKYNVTFHKANEFELAKSTIEHALYKLNYHPLWSSATHPTQNGISKIIHYTDNEYDFKIGELLCVLSSPTDYKLVKIINKTNTTIVVNITVEVKTTDYIIPAVKIIPNNRTSFSYQHNLYQKITYNLEVLDE